jgi:hypothetical protein
LFCKVSKPRYSGSKCHIQDGYSYTLSESITPKVFYRGRSIEDFPGFAELGDKLWVKLWHYLSPVLKACPPNGVQVLTYPGKFDSYISLHKDMNPDMAIDPKNNSQIVGSSVIVVSLLDTMRVEFCKQTRQRNSKGEMVTCFEMVDYFNKEDRSAYVLDPNDDLDVYHRVFFLRDFIKEERSGGKRKKEHIYISSTPRCGKVRVAITYCWLGKRAEFFCDDYSVHSRCHCQVIHGAVKELSKSKNKARWEAHLRFMKHERK